MATKRKSTLEERIPDAMSNLVDVESRTLFLFDEITHESALKFCVAFRLLDQTEGKITIMLSSGGGSESAGYAIYDTIKLAKNLVTIEGFGLVQSMAALILQAGSERLLAPETRFMIHYGTIDMGTNEVDSRTFESIAVENKEQLTRYSEIMANITGIDASKIINMMNNETYFSASEAVDYNFADGVLGE